LLQIFHLTLYVACLDTACLIQLGWRLSDWGQWQLIAFHWWSWPSMTRGAFQKKIKTKPVKNLKNVEQKLCKNIQGKVSLLSFCEVINVHNHFSYSLWLCLPWKLCPSWLWLVIEESNWLCVTDEGRQISITPN